MIAQISWIALICGVVWAALAFLAWAAIGRYFRRQRPEGSFWQFTIKQALLAFSLWTLVVWMFYLWLLDRFNG
jgi:hypothetical protein